MCTFPVFRSLFYYKPFTLLVHFILPSCLRRDARPFLDFNVVAPSRTGNYFLNDYALNPHVFKTHFNINIVLSTNKTVSLIHTSHKHSYKITWSFERR